MSAGFISAEVGTVNRVFIGSCREPELACYVLRFAAFACIERIFSLLRFYGTFFTS